MGCRRERVSSDGILPIIYCNPSNTGSIDSCCSQDVASKYVGAGCMHPCWASTPIDVDKMTLRMRRRLRRKYRPSFKCSANQPINYFLSAKWSFHTVHKASGAVATQSRGLDGEAPRGTGVRAPPLGDSSLSVSQSNTIRLHSRSPKGTDDDTNAQDCDISNTKLFREAVFVMLKIWRSFLDM